MNLGEAVNLGQNLTGGFRVGLRRVNNSNKGVDDALMTSGQFALTYTF